MYKPKAFKGVSVSLKGQEDVVKPEGQEVPYQVSVENALTNLAYLLFELTSRRGVTLDYPRLVQTLAGKSDISSEVVESCFQVNEMRQAVNQEIGKLMDQFIATNGTKITDVQAEKLRQAARQADKPKQQDDTMYLKIRLREALESVVKALEAEGRVIVDVDAFTDSLLKAVVESDQEGYEVLQTGRAGGVKRHLEVARLEDEGNE